MADFDPTSMMEAPPLPKFTAAQWSTIMNRLKKKVGFHGEDKDIAYDFELNEGLTTLFEAVDISDLFVSPNDQHQQEQEDHEDDVNIPAATTRAATDTVSTEETVLKKNTDDYEEAMKLEMGGEQKEEEIVLGVIVTDSMKLAAVEGASSKEPTSHDKNKKEGEGKPANPTTVSTSAQVPDVSSLSILAPSSAKSTTNTNAEIEAQTEDVTETRHPSVSTFPVQQQIAIAALPQPAHPVPEIPKTITTTTTTTGNPDAIKLTLVRQDIECACIVTFLHGWGTAWVDKTGNSFWVQFREVDSPAAGRQTGEEGSRITASEEQALGEGTEQTKEKGMETGVEENPGATDWDLAVEG